MNYIVELEAKKGVTGDAIFLFVTNCIDKEEAQENINLFLKEEYEQSLEDFVIMEFRPAMDIEAVLVEYN